MAKARRSYGTGSLYVHTGKAGMKTWYGRWYSGGKRTRPVIGPRREAGSREGLTRAEAEAELRRLMHEARVAQDRASLTIATVGERLLHHLEIVGRKPTTLATYRSTLETHLLPAFGTLPLGEVDPERIENLMATMQESGKAAKTRANALVLLHQLFHFAERNGWCADNPCTRVERPQVEPSLDIRFLDEAEFEALLEAIDVAREPLGHVDRAMFLTAAMTGMRQGSCSPYAGETSIGERRRFGFAATMCAGTGAHRSRAGASDRCRSGLESRGSLSSYASATSTTQTKTSSSGIPLHGRSARPLAAHPTLQVSAKSVQPARVSLQRSTPHLRDQDGRRRHTDAGSPGVVGAPQHQHHGNLC